jgi:hypothetical protein
VFGRSGRFALALSPVVATFAAAEWMVATGSASFTDLLSFAGVVVISFLGGLYPVLLLASSRRKGEHVSRTAHGLLGRPALLVVVYLIFLAALFLHSVVIWDDPVERAGALAAGIVMLALPALLWRSGAFSRRLTVEVRDDQRLGRASFAMVCAGRPAPGEVRLRYPDREQRLDGTAGHIPEFASLRDVVYELRLDSAARPAEVKAWAHRVTAEGESEPLPARVRVRVGGEVGESDLSLSQGVAFFPVNAGGLEVEIALKDTGAR